MDSFLAYVDKASKYFLNLGLVLLGVGILVLCFYHNTYVGDLLGSTLIQLGLTIILINFFMSNIEIKVLQKHLDKSFRNILGIENINSKLLPDIMNLTRGGGYVVLSITEKDRFYYEKDRHQKNNMGIHEKISTKIIAKENNVHYFFKRATPTGKINKIKILKLNINEEIISPYDPDEFTIKKCVDYDYYIFERPLEKGKEYNFDFELQIPETMSDLNFKGKDVPEEDWIDLFFIQLTNKSELALEFPQDFLLQDYEFRARRQDISKLTYLPIKTKESKKMITISQENLNAGDRILVFYRKKK